MYGLDALIKLRTQNQKPTIIFINDFSSPLSRDWQKYKEDLCTIEIKENEIISKIDFRFVWSTNVSILGNRGFDRVQAIFNKCIESDAKKVLAFDAQTNEMLIYNIQSS